MNIKEVTIPRLAIGAALAGIALHAYTAIFKSDGGPSLFLAGLFLWSCLPYAVCIAIATLAKRPLAGLLGAIAALFFDASMHYSVFVAPDSSTAAIGLLFAPMVNLVLALPLGMLLAFAVTALGRRRAHP